MLLDLSSAFDMMDHDIFLSRLEYDVGLKGTVLNWSRSYLKDRKCSVRFGSSVSSAAHLHWGVPQGSILAPTLFSLYMLPLGSIFMKYDVSFHCYADDTQIYVPIKRSGNNSLEPLLARQDDIKKWMSANFFKMK